MIKIVAGKRYKTRAGQTVLVVLDNKEGNYPIVYITEPRDETNDPEAFSLTADGRYWIGSDDGESGFDIVTELPREVVRWAIYDGDKFCYSEETEAEARSEAVTCTQDNPFASFHVVKLTGTY